ncbi:MAG: hypothetical protein GVY12_00450, partial [Bacteroidetes bacterium]|nr:hypothetical protein [Bacteroidota bacterium]
MTTSRQYPALPLFGLLFLLVFPLSRAQAQVGAVADPVRAGEGMVVSAERHATAAGQD